MFRSNAPVSDNRSAVQEIQPPTRILVIGAGYAGLLFTMRLAGKVAREETLWACTTSTASESKAKCNTTH